MAADGRGGDGADGVHRAKKLEGKEASKNVGSNSEPVRRASKISISESVGVLRTYVFGTKKLVPVKIKVGNCDIKRRWV